MSYARFGTYNAVLPKGGPKVYPFYLDFSATREQVVDMAPEIEAQSISFVSGLYVNNRANGADLEIVTAAIGQSLVVPAGKQAYLPLLIGDAPQITFKTGNKAGLIVPVHVCNFPVTPYVW